MANLIQITDVTKSYFKHKVLDNVSLGINAGVFYALLGKNGAGKSTLAKFIVKLSVCEVHFEICLRQ
jgi:ABC-type multidrug transport system ATPase subunit